MALDELHCANGGMLSADARPVPCRDRSSADQSPRHSHRRSNSTLWGTGSARSSYHFVCAHARRGMASESAHPERTTRSATIEVPASTVTSGGERSSSRGYHERPVSLRGCQSAIPPARLPGPHVEAAWPRHLRALSTQIPVPSRSRRRAVSSEWWSEPNRFGPPCCHAEPSNGAVERTRGKVTSSAAMAAARR